MQCLIQLETNDDPISACRLMNIFRRKGLKLETLTIAARARGSSMLALVSFPEAELAHIFNFLRRTEGVRRVTCYRHDASADASFVLVDAEPNSSGVAGILEGLPGWKLVFASEGKYLLESKTGSSKCFDAAKFDGLEFLPLARVLGSERAAQPEPVETNAEL